MVRETRPTLGINLFEFFFSVLFLWDGRRKLEFGFDFCYLFDILFEGPTSPSQYSVLPPCVSSVFLVLFYCRNTRKVQGPSPFVSVHQAQVSKLDH